MGTKGRDRGQGRGGVKSKRTKSPLYWPADLWHGDADMKKQKKIVKSRPNTKRLLEIRMNRLKRDMERGLSDDDRKNLKWVVYG